MKKFPNDLESRLQNGLDPVYLVAGPELLLVEETCDLIRRAARHGGIVERVVFDVDARFDWNQLAAAAENLSLFATRRLIEVRLPSGKPGREGGAALRAWAKSSSDDILLVKTQAWELQSEKTAWFRDLEKAGVFVPCWAIKPYQLPKWIHGRLAARGIRADRTACTFLADRLEGNLLAAAQEIERLALLYGSNVTLDLEQLRAAVADSARFSSFRLVELVLDGQAGPAARCIRGLAESDTPMPMVVFALARELQTVGSFQTLTRKMPAVRALSELNVWKSRQDSVQSASRRLHPAAVRQALAMLSDLDLISKSNRKQEFWLQLERLCVALAMNELDEQAA